MPSLIDFLKLSLNSLKKRPLRTALTMLGVFIGIAAVVSLISLGEGLRTAITGQFSSLSADTLTLQNAGTGFGPPGSTVIEKLNEHDLRIVESVSGVKLAVPRLIRVAKLEYNKEVNFGYIASMPKTSEGYKLVYDSFQPEAEQGRLLEIGDRNKVVLGSEFVREGFFDKPVRAGTKININGKDFTIVGILKPTSTFQVNLAILMNEDEMTDLMDIGDEIDIIAIKVESAEKVEQVARELERRLRQDRGEKLGEEDFSVQTPLQALGTVNTILRIIQIIVAGIAGISLLIGAINISNTMFTGVLERTKEIGTMKAIGAKNNDILIVFLIESALLGVLGGVIGSALGIGMAFAAANAANAFFGSQIIAVSISWTLVLYAVLFSLGIGVISGVFPAWRASKLKPVEALRG